MADSKFNLELASDPGLAAWLLGIQNPSQLATHAQRGAFFETWVVSELLKACRVRRCAGGRVAARARASM